MKTQQLYLQWIHIPRTYVPVCFSSRQWISVNVTSWTSKCSQRLVSISQNLIFISHNLTESWTPVTESGRSCWFLNCPAPSSFPILWGLRLLAAGRWLIVPVNLVITIEALPSFIVITHCQLGLLRAPNFMQFSGARIVDAMEYENARTRVLNRQRKFCVWKRDIEGSTYRTCSYVISLGLLLLCQCLPLDAINAARWNIGSCKIHMSMD